MSHRLGYQCSIFKIHKQPCRPFLKSYPELKGAKNLELTQFNN